MLQITLKRQINRLLSLVFPGKPVSPGPLNCSAKKQRRVLETMVTSEGMCGLKHGANLLDVFNKPEKKVVTNSIVYQSCLR